MDEADDLSGFAYFVKICTEKHSQEKPDEQITYAQFSRTCREKWKTLDLAVKKQFVKLANEQTLGKREQLDEQDNNTSSSHQNDANGFEMAVQINGSKVRHRDIKPKVKSEQLNQSIATTTTTITTNAVTNSSRSNQIRPHSNVTVNQLQMSDVIRVASTYQPTSTPAGRKTKNRVNAYAFFIKACQEVRTTLMVEKPDFASFTMSCSRLWYEASDQQKETFFQLAKADERRYEQELQTIGPPKKRKKVRRVKRKTTDFKRKSSTIGKTATKSSSSSKAGGGGGVSKAIINRVKAEMISRKLKSETESKRSVKRESSSSVITARSVKKSGIHKTALFMKAKEIRMNMGTPLGKSRK